VSNRDDISDLQEKLWELLGIMTGAREMQNEGMIRLRREMAVKLGKPDPADGLGKVEP
jgi:hypothetical protein